MPLVELVGDAAITTQGNQILHSIGMFPLVVRKEIAANIADRLLEAAWRKSLLRFKKLHLLHHLSTGADMTEKLRLPGWWR